MLQETAIIERIPPSFASNDMLARLPNEVLSRVLQQIDTVHLLKEVMLLSKHWRNIIAQTADVWTSIKIEEPSFHPCALIPVVHHVRRLDLHLNNRSWTLNLYEHVAEFCHFIHLSVRAVFCYRSDGSFTNNGWLFCDRLEVLDICVYTWELTLENIMSACPKLKRLTYQNCAGLGSLPQGGYPIRVGLTSLFIAIDAFSSVFPEELEAVLKACPNIRNLGVYPCYEDLFNVLENAAHDLESLDWNSEDYDVPWVGNKPKTSTKRTQCCGHGGDGSLLKHLRALFASDIELNRMLTKYGRNLEILDISLGYNDNKPTVFPPLQYDHTFFKRIQTLAFFPDRISYQLRSHEIIVIILKLCDTHVLEHLTLGYFDIPLGAEMFHRLTLFSRLHTLRLRHLTCTEGIEIYLTAMAMMGSHAPLTVVELRAVPLTAAQLVILASISTLQNVGLFALSDQVTTTEDIHQFLLKLQQHKQLQSITLDEVEAVRRDTLIECIGKISSLRILTICAETLMIADQDIADFTQLYPAIRLKYIYNSSTGLSFGWN